MYGYVVLLTPTPPHQNKMFHWLLQVISLPIVVIVHGSQDNNALATIIWDCAFSEPVSLSFPLPASYIWPFSGSIFFIGMPVICYAKA